MKKTSIAALFLLFTATFLFGFSGRYLGITQQDVETFIEYFDDITDEVYEELEEYGIDMYSISPDDIQVLEENVFHGKNRNLTRIFKKIGFTGDDAIEKIISLNSSYYYCLYKYQLIELYGGETITTENSGNINIYYGDELISDGADTIYDIIDIFMGTNLNLMNDDDFSIAEPALYAMAAEIYRNSYYGSYEDYSDYQSYEDYYDDYYDSYYDEYYDSYYSDYYDYYSSGYNDGYDDYDYYGDDCYDDSSDGDSYFSDDITEEQAEAARLYIYSFRGKDEAASIFYDLENTICSTSGTSVSFLENDSYFPKNSYRRIMPTDEMDFTFTNHWDTFFSFDLTVTPAYAEWSTFSRDPETDEPIKTQNHIDLTVLDDVILMAKSSWMTHYERIVTTEELGIIHFWKQQTYYDYINSSRLSIGDWILDSGNDYDYW